MQDLPAPQGDGSQTTGHSYAERLQRLQITRWKRILDVQRPYRWNLQRLNLGRVLDIGCGIGRNLENLGGNGVGVDHNQESVMLARARGLTAFTPSDFHDSAWAVADGFDSMILAHVLEHVNADVANDMVREYLVYLRSGGKILFITPQEAGYHSDATHVRFVDLAGLHRHAGALGLEVLKAFSFPLPRLAGKLFKYNEFVMLSRVPERL